MTLHHLGYQLSRTPLPNDTFDQQEYEKVAKILLEILALYVERNSERKGIWRRAGLRGQTQNVFAKGERAFTQVMAGEIPNEDNYRDAIVYSVFALLLMRECGLPDPKQAQIYVDACLNGLWPWEGK